MDSPRARVGGMDAEHNDAGDTYRSAPSGRHGAANRHSGPAPLPIATGYCEVLQRIRARCSHHSQHREGKKLLEMIGWSMAFRIIKTAMLSVLNDRRPSDLPFFRSAQHSFHRADEHYYGLGQNQEGYLDHRGHTVHCWHDYTATGGPSIGVPFLVTNRGYGADLGQPIEDHREARIQRADALGIGGGQPGLVLRHCGKQYG